MNRSIHVKSISTRAKVSEGAVEFIFKDSQSQSVSVTVPNDSVPAFVTNVNIKAQETLEATDRRYVHALEATSISAQLAKNGTPVILIGTKSTPQIAFAVPMQNIAEFRAALDQMVRESLQ